MAVWFEPPKGCGVSVTVSPDEEAALIAQIIAPVPPRLTAPRRSKARWLLAAAFPAAAAAVAIAVLLPAEFRAPASAPSQAAVHAAAAPAPTSAGTQAIDDDENLLPVPLFTLDEAPAPRAVRPARAEARPRIHLTAPSAGLDRKTAALNAAAARFAQRQDWKSALLLYQRSTRLAPNDPAGWFGLALCHFELRHPRAADDAARTALLADPGHPLANLLVGFLAQEDGRFGEARFFYSSYLSVDPRGPYAAELVSVLEQLPVL